MSDVKVEIDKPGIAAIAKSPDAAAAVAAGAAAVIANLPAGVEAYVDYYETDRAVAAVTVAGHGAELKYGRLAAAATRAGLEFRGTA